MATTTAMERATWILRTIGRRRACGGTAGPLPVVVDKTLPPLSRRLRPLRPEGRSVSREPMMPRSVGECPPPVELHGPWELGWRDEAGQIEGRQAATLAGLRHGGRFGKAD